MGRLKQKISKDIVVFNVFNVSEYVYVTSLEFVSTLLQQYNWHTQYKRFSKDIYKVFKIIICYIYKPPLETSCIKFHMIEFPRRQKFSWAEKNSFINEFRNENSIHAFGKFLPLSLKSLIMIVKLCAGENSLKLWIETPFIII